MRIFVTGSSGFLGGHFCRRMLESGYEVTAIVRSDSKPSPLGIRRITFESLRRCPPPDVVVNFAGSPIAVRWTEERKKEIYSSRVETTRKLVQWMEEAGPPKVFLSSSGVGFYGHRPGNEGRGEPLDESASADPARSFRSQICVDWEAEAMRAAALGARVVLMRLGVVLDERLGNRDSPTGGALGVALPYLRVSPFLMPVAPRAFVPWIGLDDAIGLIAELAEDSRYVGAVNVVAPESVTMRELTKAVGEILRRPVFGSVPAPMARLALGELAEAIVSSQRVVPAKALRANFPFSTPTLGTWTRRVKVSRSDDSGRL